MRFLCTIFAIVLFLLSIPTISAQDPGVPDSVRIGDAVGDIEMESSFPFEVPVSVFNDNDLTEIVIPLIVDGYSGWTFYDSVSYVGGRLSDANILDMREVTLFGTDMRTVDSIILKFEIDAGNPLPAGDGTICELWFRPVYGGDILIDSLDDTPHGSFSFATAPDNIYKPAFQSGSIFIECDYLIGDLRPDDVVNTSDMLGIMKGYIGCFSFDYTDPWHADLNCDRYTDLRDIVAIIDHIYTDSIDEFCTCGSYSEPIYNDPGIPDTVWVETDTLYVGILDTISVGIINDENLRGFAFGLEWYGDGGMTIDPYNSDAITAPRLQIPNNYYVSGYQCPVESDSNRIYAGTWPIAYPPVSIAPGTEAVYHFVVVPEAEGTLNFRFVDYPPPYGYHLSIGAESMMVDEYKAAIIPALVGEITILPRPCGDANKDAEVNVSDAVWIINWVFAGGQDPDPLEIADANCDGDVNVSDAVWVINYVFTGGNAPCDIDGDGQDDC